MSVFFIGAMPWLQLFDNGVRTAWASVAQADWSPHETGRLITLRQCDRLRVISSNEGWPDGLSAG